MKSLTRVLKTIQTLGFSSTAEAARYALQKKNPNLDIPRKRIAETAEWYQFKPLPLADDRLSLKEILEQKRQKVFSDAAEVMAGQFKPFYRTESCPIDLSCPSKQVPWRKIEYPEQFDLKDIWESARFCWVAPLIQAYILQPDPSYVGAFYQQLRSFIELNPPFFGENWLSAQEAAIRLIWISIGASVLAPIPDDVPIGRIIALHAERITQTRAYAKAQRNNHWLSESAGLITAAAVLPNHPDSPRWYQRGWNDFQTALKDQILPDGAYIQQSANYHRLMLQLALWVDFLIRLHGTSWPEKLREQLGKSVEWLAKLTNEQNGQAWNLGHNDGSLLFPFSGDYSDYRPTLQAAASVFSRKHLYPEFSRNELSVWLNITQSSITEPLEDKQTTFLDLTVPTLTQGTHSATMRVASFKGRPAHADQLHVSIWNNGQCLALDPGTYRYSAQIPWNNGLKSAWVHNSPVINGQEPMADISKFLWGEWDQARILDLTAESVTAEHFGYQKLGVRHCRTLKKRVEGWQIIDDLSHVNTSRITENYSVQLNWLIPNLTFQADSASLSLETELFSLRFESSGSSADLQVIRCGNIVYPEDGYLANPKYSLMGWNSPTYSQREPALSILLKTGSTLPLQIITNWKINRFGEHL
ncbi:MAG: hypothetical protein GX933_01780 [Chloroflexi bacterium]|nr:hypothetical protein [Chloroflexota bacterium]